MAQGLEAVRRCVMRCERCETETDAGAQYRFYYGTYASSQHIDRRHTLQRYQIGGSEGIFICDRCLDRHTNRMALLASAGVAIIILVVGLLRLLVGGPAPEGSELETVFAFPLAAVAGPILYLMFSRGWRKGQSREGIGDKLAIRLRKARLKRAGYNRFFTRAQYSRLHRC
jgi:hypothetical protein